MHWCSHLPTPRVCRSKGCDPGTLAQPKRSIHQGPVRTLQGSASRRSPGHAPIGCSESGRGRLLRTALGLLEACYSLNPATEAHHGNSTSRACAPTTGTDWTPNQRTLPRSRFLSSHLPAWIVLATLPFWGRHGNQAAEVDPNGSERKGAAFTDSIGVGQSPSSLLSPRTSSLWALPESLTRDRVPRDYLNDSAQSLNPEVLNPNWPRLSPFRGPSASNETITSSEPVIVDGLLSAEELPTRAPPVGDLSPATSILPLIPLRTPTELEAPQTLTLSLAGAELPREWMLGEPILQSPWQLAANPSDWGRGQEAITRESLARGKAPFEWVWGIRSGAVSDSNPTLTRHPAGRAFRVELGPQVRIQLGRNESRFQIGADYSGTYTRNLDSPHLAFFEHHSAVDTRWLGSRLRIGLRGALNFQQSGLRDTGARSVERTISGRLQTNFQATEKLSNELSLDLSRSRFPAFSGSEEARLRAFFDYALGPKLQLGLGAGVGQLQPQNGGFQKYAQALLRAAYHPTAKLSWNASVGLEDRSVRNDGRPGAGDSSDTLRNPVFSISGLWMASARASFTLEAERRSLSSAALNDTNFQSTRLRLGWNEQITNSVQTRLSAGYEQAEYQSTLVTRTSVRQDDYWLGRFEIQWSPRKHSTLGLFLESCANHSSDAELYSFRRTQLGVNWNLHF
jgi:hypothetical protein